MKEGELASRRYNGIYLVVWSPWLIGQCNLVCEMNRGRVTRMHGLRRVTVKFNTGVTLTVLNNEQGCGRIMLRFSDVFFESNYGAWFHPLNWNYDHDPELSMNRIPGPTVRFLATVTSMISRLGRRLLPFPLPSNVLGASPQDSVSQLLRKGK